MKKDTEPHPVRLLLRIGGVRRCCMKTLNKAKVTENEGDTLLCQFCKSRLIVKDQKWQWDSDYEPEAKP